MKGRQIEPLVGMWIRVLIHYVTQDNFWKACTYVPEIVCWNTIQIELALFKIAPHSKCFWVTRNGRCSNVLQVKKKKMEFLYEKER